MRYRRVGMVTTTIKSYNRVQLYSAHDIVIINYKNDVLRLTIIQNANKQTDTHTHTHTNKHTDDDSPDYKCHR